MRISSENDSPYWNNPDVVKTFSDLPSSLYVRGVLEEIHDKKGMTALDLGCGGGRNTELFLELGFYTCACDINPSMVEATTSRVASKFPSTTFEVNESQMSELLYEDNTFNVVLANGVIHNAVTEIEFERTFLEIARIIKTGGLLILSIFNGDDIDESSLKPYPSSPIFVTNEGMLMVLYPTSHIIQLLHQIGFTPITEIENYISEVETGKRSIMRGVFVKD